MKKPGMTLSLRFCLTFTAVVLLIIVGIAVANNILLGKIYDREKRSSLIEAYETINRVFTEELGADSLELEKIYSTKNIDIVLLDSDGNELFSSAANAGEIPPPQERGQSGDVKEPEPPSQPEGGRPRGDRHRDGMKGFEYRWIAEKIDERLGGESYVIDEMNDDRLGAGFIQLMARLANGNILYMRTPTAAVDEAADTANRLLVFIGIAAVIISLIVIAAVSGAVTKPIRQLTEIARDMAELRFSRRYDGRRSDEIGELGASINIMSDRLEAAIGELKSANAALEKDIELKESIDRARKDFIANAGHELKTPLALISGYAEGLRTNIASSPEDRELYCDVIVDEAGRMDKIIKQLLTMTELDSVYVPEKRELDLGGLVRSAVKRVGILAAQKGAEIELSCPETLSVVGDAELLDQAVTNYLTNAIHYVDEKKIIRAELKKTDGGARFSVYNSGKPISDENAARVWDSFWKQDKARTRAYGGTGLGLAIVKRSVELHGGKCGLRNADGGVEFYFEI